MAGMLKSLRVPQLLVSNAIKTFVDMARSGVIYYLYIEAFALQVCVMQEDLLVHTMTAIELSRSKFKKLLSPP